MKRMIWTLGVGSLLILTASVVSAQGGEEFSPRRGAAVYAEFCQACHGPRGEAVASGPAFSVAIRYSPDTTRDVIARGQDSNPEDDAAMPPYAQMHGGLLTEQQIGDLIAYMESWEAGDTPALPEPNIRLSVEEVPNYFGDLYAGAVIYAKFCNGCHGKRGEGRVPPNFPPFEVNDETITIVRDGHPSPYMPAFGEEAGGPLSEQDLDNLETYLASWALEQSAQQDNIPEGASALLVIMGVGAVLLVGMAYLTRRPRYPTQNPDVL